MSEDAFPRLRRIERRTTTYALPPGADVLVRPGQGIGPDAPLARVPRMPLIEPYAADLHAAPPDAFMALNVRDGAHVRGGELIARRRTGLRTQALTAVTNGIVAVRPDAGFYTLTPIVPTEILSQYGGTVQAVSPHAVVVASVIECVRCGFTSPQATGDGPLFALPNPHGRINENAAEIVLIPHLANLALLRAMTRAGATLLVAGTVSDAVSWELLTARTRSGMPLPRSPHVAAIIGPGDATEGTHIFAMLRAWENRTVWLEDTGGAPTLCTEAQSGRAALPEERPTHHVVLRDPAHWGETATVVPTPPAAVPVSGLAQTVIIHGAGQTVIPAQNAVVPLDETYE